MGSVIAFWRSLLQRNMFSNGQSNVPSQPLHASTFCEQTFLIAKPAVIFLFDESDADIFLLWAHNNDANLHPVSLYRDHVLLKVSP